MTEAGLQVVILTTSCYNRIVMTETTTTLKLLHFDETTQQGIQMAANTEPHPDGWQGYTALRTTSAIPLAYDPEVSKRLTEICGNRQSPYDAALVAIGQAAEANFAAALEQAIDFAKEKGNEIPLMPTAAEMINGKHIPSQFDLQALLKVWNTDGTTEPIGAVDIQRVFMQDATDAWRKKWNARRKARHSVAKIEAHNASASKDEQWKIRPAQAKKAAEDPFDITSLLLANKKDKPPMSAKSYEPLLQGTGWIVDEADGRQKLKLKGMDKLRIVPKREIAGLAELEKHNPKTKTKDSKKTKATGSKKTKTTGNKLGIRTWQIEEVTPEHRRAKCPPEHTKWAIRLTLRVPVPTPISPADITPDKMVGIDRGVAAQVATSKPIKVGDKPPTHLHSMPDIMQLASLYKLLRMTEKGTGRRLDKQTGEPKNLTREKAEFKRRHAEATPGDIKIAIRIAKLWQKIDKCQPDSNRRAELQRRLNKIHQQLARRAEHWAANLANAIADQYPVIVLEDLKTSSMVLSAKGTEEQHGVNVSAKSGLNRVIHRANWGRTGSHTKRQPQRVGGHQLGVPASYTSRRCAKCKKIDTTDTIESRPSQAEWKCINCKHEDNADINASKIVEQAGFTKISTPTKSKKSESKPKKVSGEEGGSAARLKSPTDSPQGKSDNAPASARAETKKANKDNKRAPKEVVENGHLPEHTTRKKPKQASKKAAA